MYLMVMPNGSRYWRMNYRFAGRAKTLALGTYPDTEKKPDLPPEVVTELKKTTRREATLILLNCLILCYRIGRIRAF